MLEWLQQDDFKLINIMYSKTCVQFQAEKYDVEILEILLL